MQPAVYSKSIPLTQGDDWCVNLTIIGAIVPMKNIRDAIRAINDFKSNEVFIGRPNSPYDCTGQPFTTNIVLINKSAFELEDGMQDVIYIYKHYISFDV